MLSHEPAEQVAEKIRKRQLCEFAGGKVGSRQSERLDAGLKASST